MKGKGIVLNLENFEKIGLNLWFGLSEEEIYR